MDKRLLVAVGLSIAVLIVFQTWFAPEPPVRQPEAEHPVPEHAAAGTPGARPGTARIPDSPVMEIAPVEHADAPGGWTGADQEQRIEVRTPLVVAEFSNRGAALTSWQLTQYAGVERATPVELVRDTQGEFTTVLETTQGLEDLSGVLYSVSESTGENGARILLFQAERADGLRVQKTYVIPQDGYVVELATRIDGAPAASGFRVVWDGGIPPAEDDKLYEMSVATIALLGKERENLKPGAFKKEPVRELDGVVKWAGVRNKYFSALMVPEVGDSERIVANGDNATRVTGAAGAFPVLSGQASNRMGLYLGPLDFDGMKAVGNDLDQAVDLGWKIFRPLSAALLHLMTWMYKFIPNYGLVIILISVLTKVVFYPLTKSSIRSMKAMQALQPQVTAVREKYKKDPKRLQEETMLLYKKNKVNPLGGCLPMLVQMPVFFALYSVLSNSITMRAAPFVSWINDLSVPETLFSIGPLPIHVLPIVMFATSLLQAKLTPMSGDPRQKLMGYMMPAVLLFVFYSFPAGLNLYWTVNNIMQVGQQWMIYREHPVATPAPSPA